jgi:hypothetical protein
MPNFVFIPNDNFVLNLGVFTLQRRLEVLKLNEGLTVMLRKFSTRVASLN